MAVEGSRNRTVTRVASRSLSLEKAGVAVAHKLGRVDLLGARRLRRGLQRLAWDTMLSMDCLGSLLSSRETILRLGDRKSVV